MHRGYRDLRDLFASKAAWPFLALTFLLLCPQTAAWGMTPDQLLQQSSRGCPSTLAVYGRINGSDVCNPNKSVLSACNALKLGSLAQSECYARYWQCSRQVDAENDKIYAYNKFIYDCASTVRKQGGKPVWLSKQHQPVQIPSSLVTPAVYQQVIPAPAPPIPAPPQNLPPNPYIPDPLRQGAQIPDPGADPDISGIDPDYGGVSVGVDPIVGQDNSGLDGIVGKVKKLTTP